MVMATAPTEGQLALGLRLDPGRRFESYHPGPNSLAAAAVRAMAEGDGESQLFL